MAIRRGGCLCGSVSYRVEGELDPGLQFTCHCRDCQQVTGTGHARSMGVQRSMVTWAGKPRIYELTSAEGNRVETAFCDRCGAPMYKATAKAPDLVFIHAGSLEPGSSEDWSSRQSIHTENRPPWDRLEER